MCFGFWIPEFFKRNWLFLLIVLILLFINILVLFFYETGMEIEMAGYFVETMHLVILK